MASFYATNNTTQAIPSSTVTKVDLQTEITDTEGAFASSIFTVPAGLDGQYMVFSGGVAATTSPGQNVYIQEGTGSPVTWLAICQNGSTSVGADASTVTTGPVLLATGVQYRLSVWYNSGYTIANEAHTFFGGSTISTQSAFRAERVNGTNALTANVSEVHTMDSIPFDTVGGYDLAYGKFVCPTELDGQYALFYTGIRFSAAENHYLQIIENDPTVSPEVETIIAENDWAGQAGTVQTGVIKLIAGREYYPKIESSSSATVSDSRRNNFSMVTVDLAADAGWIVGDPLNHYDFSDTGTTTVTSPAGLITAITDKGIGADDMAADSGEEPTESTLNGVTCASFDGIDNLMYTSTGTASNSFTMHVVFELQSIPSPITGLCVMGRGSTGSVDPYVILGVEGTTGEYLYRHVDSGAVSVSASNASYVAEAETDYLSVNVLSCSWNYVTETQNLYLNGVKIVTDNDASAMGTNENPSGYISFGALKTFANESSHAEVKIGEALHYNYQMSDTQVLRIFNYLDQKWRRADTRIATLERFALVRAPDNATQIAAIGRFTLARVPDNAVQIAAVSRFTLVREP